MQQCALQLIGRNKFLASCKVGALHCSMNLANMLHADHEMVIATVETIESITLIVSRFTRCRHDRPAD